MKSIKISSLTWGSISRLILITAIISISVYLTWAHYAQTTVLCPANVLHVPISCSLVLDSKYDVIFSLPVSLWGGIWALGYFFTKKSRGLGWPFWVMAGLTGIVWAIGHEITLHAICMWCTFMQISIITVICGELIPYFKNIHKNSLRFINNTRTTISIVIPLVLICNLAVAIVPPITKSASVSSQDVVFNGLNDEMAELPQGPVMIEVMAPWCAYCATEARFALTGAAEEAQSKGASFIIVDVSDLGGVAQAADEPTLPSIQTTASDGSRVPLSSNLQIAENLSQFAELYPVNAPFLFLPLGEQLPQNWKFENIPETILLDGNHQLISTLSGFNNLSNMKIWIDKQLSKTTGVVTLDQNASTGQKMTDTAMVGRGNLTASKLNGIDQTDVSNNPVITSVTPVMNEGNPVIVIQGSGFGSTFPLSDIGNKTDSNFLKVSSGVWSAGYSEPGAWFGPDWCNATVATWSDNQIIVQLWIGGDATSGSIACPLVTGTNLQLTVWNTSTNAYSNLYSFPVIATVSSPVVSGVSPRYGSGPITITGSGFTGAQVVWFGSYPTTDIAVLSDTEISVATPPQDPNYEGVSIQVTVPGHGTNPDECPIIQKGCADAYFYMQTSNVNFNTGPVNVSASISVGSNGENATISISGELDLVLNATSQLSANVGIPSAWLVNGDLQVVSSDLTITVTGNLNTDQKLPIPGLTVPDVIGLYFRVAPQIGGSFSQSVDMNSLTIPISGGFLPDPNSDSDGVVLPGGQILCNGMPLSLSNFGECLTTPNSGSISTSVEIFPFWFQIGPDLKDVGDMFVGIGPGIGLGYQYETNNDVWDICGAVDAEAQAQLSGIISWSWDSTIGGTYNLASSNNDDAVSACPFYPSPSPDPPGSPTYVNATAGNGEATVTWTPPQSDGGGDITNYLINSSPPSGQGPVTVNGDAPPSIIITGLKNGTSYTFTVTAKNASGYGTSSLPSPVVVPQGTGGHAASFSPTSGAVNSSIFITGSGWLASESVTSVTLGGVAATNTLSVSATGTLSGNITVPSESSGAKTIVITGSVSGAQTFANAFTVTVLLSRTASFSPSSGPSGNSITVNGSGWSASESISTVTLGGVAAPNTLTVSAAGALSGNITVPSESSGAKTIVITGSISGAQTFMNAFTVTVLLSPTASFSPTSGAVGSSILITGLGWASSESIGTVTLGGAAAPNTLTVSAAGALSGNITVPSESSGAKAIVITGSVSGAQTFANAFIVTILTQLIITTPSQLHNAQDDVYYSQQLSASGGTPPYTWSVIGNFMPSGLHLSSSGLLYGTPVNAAGSSDISVQVEDSANPPQSKPQDFDLDIAQSTVASTLHLNPSPIAAAASLAAGASVSVDLNAVNADQVQVVGGTVYLAFTPTTGGGSASVGSVALTSTPSPFTTNSGGNVIITYTAPASLPGSGMDILQAYTALTGGTSVVDGYSFAGPSALAVTNFSLLTEQAYPTGIATAPDGSLWFGQETSTAGYPALGHITLSGNITEFSLPSGDIPMAILVDHGGNVWFTDCNKNAIGELIPSTGNVQEFPTPTWSSHPIDMTLGPDGNIWFAESNQDIVGEITESGIITEYQVGPQGSGSGINGIAAGPDGYIWFTDYTTNEIGRINPSTKQILPFFSLPQGGKIFDISGIVSGPGNMMWFDGIYGVASITLNGTITEYLLPGSGSPSDYPAPHIPIVLGSDGNIWTQMGNIFRISPQGTYTEMTAPASSDDITLGPDDNLWFTDFTRNVVGRISVTPITVDNIAFSQSVIAPIGSLVAGQSVDVVVQVSSKVEGAVGNTPLLVSFIAVPNGGSASVGQTTLGSIAQVVVTNTSGQISIVYTVPSSLPNGGTDSIIVQAESNMSIPSVIDSYIFASSDATLSNLIVSSGTLNPSFVSGTTAYTVGVTNSVSSLTVTPTANQSQASIEVNGTVVTNSSASESISLNVGNNTIGIAVTAQDGITQNIYTITVSRAAPPSSDATLSNLIISSGTLNPSFVSGTTAYTVGVTNSVSSLTVTPTANQSQASIEVNGTVVASGSVSEPISLNVGNNTIGIAVTAQGGITQDIYTITVSRAAPPSSDATLSNLIVSSGTLNPSFVSGTTAYTVGVTNSVSSLTVTPTANQSQASIYCSNGVNGTLVASGNVSEPISLNVGNNTINVLIVAQDGVTTKTYTVTVTRATVPSNDATLSNLTVSSVTLTPVFASATTSYTDSVTSSISSITVTPTVNQSNATVTVNGTAVTSGSASSSINLNVGSNTITIVVTAQDGVTTKTYTITVTRTSLGVTVTVSAPAKVPANNYQFDVPVNLSQVSNFYGAQFDVLYDSTVLQYVSTTWGQIGSTPINGSGITQSNIITPGDIRFVIDMTNLSSGISGTGTILTLRFQVIGSIGKSSTINLANGILSDFNANAILATWVNGSVLVSVIPGDANGDGVVNVLDLTKVAREILGLDTVTPGADANGDGVVNVLDMTKIARIILGLDP